MSGKAQYQQLKEIDEALNSIERNCGSDGYSWESN